MPEPPFIYDELANVPTCHASTVVELPNGDLLAAWYGGERESSPDSSHYYARLRKGDSQWDEPACLWDVPDHSAGNPRLFLAADERLWAILPVNYGQWCRGGSRFYYRTSDDAGETWGEPVRVEHLQGMLGKNKPLVMPSGEFLLPVTNEFDHTSAAVIYDPAKDKWDISSPITRPDGGKCIQPAFVMLSDGRILAYMRTDSSAIWRSYSREGRAWTPAEPTDLPNNDSGIDLARLSNGHLVLAYNHARKGEGRTPLCVAVSTDDGATWPHRIDLETEKAEFSYPAVIVGCDDTIHITYTHRRRHIAYVALREEDVIG